MGENGDNCLFVCLLTRKETLCKDAEIIAKGHMNCEWDSRQWRGGIEKKDIIKRVMRLFCLFQFSIFFNPSCPRDSCYLSVCFCIPLVYQCLCMWLHLCFWGRLYTVSRLLTKTDGYILHLSLYHFTSFQWILASTLKFC